MKFAAVSNAGSIEYLPHTGYNLVLSDQAYQHPRMAAYYAKRVRKGDVVILDHPIHERKPVPSLTKILALIEEIRPTYTIIPDVIGDPDATYEASKYFAPLFASRGTKPMAVVQGKNEQEYRQSIEALVTITKYIGLPLIRKYEQIDRAKFVRSLDEFFTNFPWVRIHLLGSDNTFADAVALRNHPKVLGIDSAKPIYLALSGQHFSKAKRWGRPVDYFELPEKTAFLNSDLIEENVNLIARMVGGDNDTGASLSRAGMPGLRES